MDYFITVIFFIFGSVLGSFLNVVAYRFPRGESVVFPPSHCPKCGERIKSLDNIPILSYLLLHGRCRGCGGKISLRYPLIELITGLLWAAAYSHFGLTLQLALGLFFITVLIVLSAIDYDTKTIPNKILLPSIAISLLFMLPYLLSIETIPVITGARATEAVIGSLAGGGFLYVVAILAPLIFKKEAMGGGDIKLAAFAGLYLGGYVMLALFIGFFMGAIAGIALIAKDKSRARDMIPFGPFISAGAILTVFFGPQLWSEYLSIAGLS
ncbi:MAG: prepilin peptidase [Actinobacteria bacterium]|nr:prepilin peptidase [Actinomycetota bacterium]